MDKIKHTHLPLVALRAFEAAGRLGTMTAASEELCVTPGAVSRQIRQLEKLVGVALFSGSKNKPVLSEHGLLLAPILSSAMQQMLAGVNAIRLAGKKSVTVSCLNTFSIRCLIPRLYRFNHLFPDIDIKLSTTSTDDSSDDYDVVIGVTKGPEGHSGNQCVLFHEKIGPVVTPDLMARYSIHKPEDLQAVPVLQARTRLNAWGSWCRIISKEIVPPTEVKFDHLYFTLEAVLGGLGFCVAPQHLVSDDIRAGRLSAPFGFVESGYSYVIRQPDSSHHNATEFVEWLKEQVFEG
ncbi:MAG: LysR family glycine cleavage system transcriptional activator [Candidatus Endobugula sp.]|jgi:LysR family glycine cleavage system transcriptional activator